MDESDEELFQWMKNMADRKGWELTRRDPGPDAWRITDPTDTSPTMNGLLRIVTERG